MRVHFFTIVLNGMPFIKHHFEEFKKLTFPWCWHIIEGLAELKGDTSWGLSNGAYIPEGFHKNGLSADGTTEYLDSLPLEGNVIIYRLKSRFWNGKTEMVNAPITWIHEDCLLWQVDHDELWKAEDIERTRKLFLDNPNKHSAFFYCFYFLGPKRYIISENVKSTRAYDWLRVWRFKDGMRWATHEPPILMSEKGEDVGKIDPYTRADTMIRGITFQHFAYATLPNVEFKEAYYGYKGLTKKWEELQGWNGTVVIGEGFPGVDPGTVIGEWDEKRNGKLLWES